MWRSCLLIDVGTNPDRPRPGRTWLRDLYHVHQRLCMAFPSDARKERDPMFLAPFDPADLECKVHGAERRANSGFLFRIDPQPGGRVVIVVESARQPDWDYAFGLKDGLVNDRGQPIGNAGHLLAAPPHKEPFECDYREGDRLRFRIRVNLSKKIKQHADGTDARKKKVARMDRKGREKSQSQRVALTWGKDKNPGEVIRLWLSKKAEPKRNDKGESLPGLGFEVESLRVLQMGWGSGFKPNHSADDGENGSRHRHLKFRSALLEGTLRVTEAQSFKDTLAHGIGSGKAFGFGLLSVAPL